MLYFLSKKLPHILLLAEYKFKLCGIEFILSNPNFHHTPSHSFHPSERQLPTRSKPITHTHIAYLCVVFFRLTTNMTMPPTSRFGLPNGCLLWSLSNSPIETNLSVSWLPSILLVLLPHYGDDEAGCLHHFPSCILWSLSISRAGTEPLSLHNAMLCKPGTWPCIEIKERRRDYSQCSKCFRNP